jgi:hypothetical protein
MSRLLQLALLLVVLKLFAPELFTLSVDIITMILNIFREIVSSFQSGAPNTVNSVIDAQQTLDLTSFGL